jgi:hypothetical protein
MESEMRARLLGGAAALALTGCTFLASAGPASAQNWWWWPGAAAAGVAAAATSPLWGAPGYGYGPGYAYGAGYAYGPSYGYGPGYAYSSGGPGYAYSDGGGGGAPAYYDYVPGSNYGPAAATTAVESTAVSDSTPSCAERFKSYNPATGMYTGYDGMKHPCP